MVNAAGTSGGWTFDDPGHRGNHTGGSGAFAIVDSNHAGPSASQDSQLISPVYDLSTVLTPRLAFDTEQQMAFGRAEIDATLDGGATWTNIWEGTRLAGPAHIEVPLTQYAGKSNVRLRFHFIATNSWWWEVDDVRVGNRSYDAVPGGLVTGTVADANTGSPVVGAKVANKDAATESVLTTATPDDPHTPDGFYWMFSAATGKHPFSAAKPYYVTDAEQVKVASDRAVRSDFRLKAGRLTVKPTSVEATLALGGHTSTKLIVQNRGSAPATLTIAEHPALLPQQALPGAPLNLVKGTFTQLSIKAAIAGAGAGPVDSTATEGATAAGDAWQSAADLPTALESNLADTYDGRLYTGFGWDGKADTNALHSYDPATGVWSTLSSAVDTREAPAHGFIGDKLYVAGGWGGDGTDPKLEIYDPHTDHWSVGAALPKAYAASGSAVLNDKLYVVGGCYPLSCAGVTDVMVYDPHTDSWSQAAPYPEPITWTACGAVQGKLYCAGGVADQTPVKHAYAYDPSTDSWTQVADLPNTTWGAAYSAANGLLLVSGGVTSTPTSPALTNQGYAYNPDTNAWTALPNANTTVYRGAGATGFYVVGGRQDSHVFAPPTTTVSVLPGYNQDASPTDVDWLSENRQSVTIAPGDSMTVTITLDSGVPGIALGDYTAALSLRTNTPYPTQSIPVTMHVVPAATTTASVTIRQRAKTSQSVTPRRAL